MFSTEFYALISEVLVGSSTVTVLCIVVWLLRGGNERFVAYFRRNARKFLVGEQAQNSNTKIASVEFEPLSNQSPSRVNVTIGNPENESTGPVGEVLLYPFVAALVLGLGLAVEGTIDDAIDPHPVALKIFAAPLQYFFGSKTDFRFGALYQPVGNSLEDRGWFSLGKPAGCRSTSANSYEPTTLGMELLGTPKELFATFIPLQSQMDESEKRRWHYFLQRPDRFLVDEPFSSDPRARSHPYAVDAEQQWRRASDGKTCEGEKQLERKERCELATKVAQSLYYDGNNWAKRSEPTVNVLRRWEIQVDTVGSLSALATLTAIMTMLYVVYALLRRIPNVTKFSSALQWGTGALIVAFFCSYSYIVGLKGYTGRALGMYASAHRRDDVGVTEVACKILTGFKDITPTPRCAVAAEEPSIKVREMLKIIADKHNKTDAENVGAESHR